MTTCRGSKTLTVEAKDRVPKVLPFAAMPGFKPLVVFTAVLVLPSAIVVGRKLGVVQQVSGIRCESEHRTLSDLEIRRRLRSMLNRPGPRIWSKVCAEVPHHYWSGT